MFKIWGGINPPRIDPRELDTDKYVCIAVVENANGGLAAAYASRTPNPLHFRVLNGMCSTYYASRQEALTYLNSLKPEKEGKSL